MKAGSDSWDDLFIPDPDIYHPVAFKTWLDNSHLETRWKLVCQPQSWRNMIEKRLDQFEATRFKKKQLVEKVGTQTQTSRLQPFNMGKRRIVLGPKLYFKADGTKDDDPIHYWGNGSLSNKVGAPKLLKALDIQPDYTMDTTALIEAFMPGSFWEHQGTAGGVMSASNADIIRMKTKQHPSLILVGSMGVGKSSCQDVCMYNLAGTREVAKIDSGICFHLTSSSIASSQGRPIYLHYLWI